MQVTSVVLLVLLCYQSVATAILVYTNKPEVEHVHIQSDINFRYARTLVSTKIGNPERVPMKVNFSIPLGDDAFVTGFLMEVDGKIHNATVTDNFREDNKEDSRYDYITFRDTNRFTVSVDVEPQKKVTFNLTYEELLTRSLGEYKHVINLDPGQIVSDLSVEVRIEESSDITELQVALMDVENNIHKEGSSESPVSIKRPTPYHATVRLSLTPEQQSVLSTKGVKHQFTIQYQLDSSETSDVLVNDSYFVHFFSSPKLPSLFKYFTLLLDTGDSIKGSKMEQLKQATTTILENLNAEDRLSIIAYSDDIQIWNSTTSNTFSHDRKRRTTHTNKREMSTFPGIIRKAKHFVNTLRPRGQSNTVGALLKTLALHREIKQVPIIIIITDGKLSIRHEDREAMLSAITEANQVNASIFSVALGSNPDTDFFKKLSRRNNGFTINTNQASDTSIQLGDFYRQILTPVLSDVVFKYQPDQVDPDSLTITKFKRYFSGTELVVAGQLHDWELEGEVRGVSDDLVQYSFDTMTFTKEGPEQRKSLNTSENVLERIWAYLTIRQSLDMGHDTKAVKVALEHSFLTPVTTILLRKL